MHPAHAIPAIPILQENTNKTGNTEDIGEKYDYLDYRENEAKLE